MKFGALRFALPLCAGLASQAQAQSSLTLYGIVDAGFRHVSNSGVGSIDSLSSGGYRTSRLGIRGSEDLGGGLRVGIKLETLIGVDTGNVGSTSMPGQFWNRGSYVEILDRGWGTLRLGYDLHPVYVTWMENDPWLNIGMGSSGNLYDTLQNGPLRSVFGPLSKNDTTLHYARNMLQYFSPSLHGFSGALALAPRENETVATGAARLRLIRLGYNAGGPFSAAVAHAVSDVQLRAGTPTNRLDDSVATLAWDFGVVRLAGTWRQFRAAGSRQANWMLAATVPVSSGKVQLSHGRTRLYGTVTTQLAPGTVAGPVDGNGGAMWVLGYAHSLSKRTTLYTQTARIENRGQSFMALPGGPAVNAGNFAGGRSTGFELGIAHTF